MLGLMQDHQLLISSIFEHAVKSYPTQKLFQILLRVEYISIHIKSGVQEQSV